MLTTAKVIFKLGYKLYKRGNFEAKWQVCKIMFMV